MYRSLPTGQAFHFNFFFEEKPQKTISAAIIRLQQYNFNNLRLIIK